MSKMSIDNVPLPAFLYKDLFRKNLVDSKAGKAAVILKEEAQIHFLGGNEKQIAFLVSDPKNKFLKDNQMKFLHDLLTACHLTMADIALVNCFQAKITYRELTAQLQPKKILMFGLSANDLDLPFTIPFFQMQNFQDQSYMTSPAIEELQINVDLRKKLWGCLQTIFNLQKQK